MITVIGGAKGGTGKSTVATNLAVMNARQGADVLLVDADEQATATDFTLMRNQTLAQGAGYTCVSLTGRALATELRRLAPKYDRIVIDLGGGNQASQRGALALADVCLLPFGPRSFDVWTLQRAADVIDEARALNPGLKALAFLNRADAQGADNESAGAIIRAQPSLTFIPTPLVNRKSYPRASSVGLGVVEFTPSDAKACAEIEALYEAVFRPPRS
ncbi:AAA family ATPase [Alsobacter sp. KACC 23698]|uniref:AAA family ATPase n=1 Tax=Alsobacter sp. KACC 23698 TaxID=3149229 RepID=A0AAU7JIZ0_9HYPH